MEGHWKLEDVSCLQDIYPHNERNKHEVESGNQNM